MRLIDADELNEVLNWTRFKPPYSKRQVRRFIEMVRTVEAEPKWILVNERLPEDNRWKQIIITLDPSYGDGKRMVSRCAYFTHGRFYSCESHGVYMNSAVKAWMPLPEPYEVKHE